MFLIMMTLIISLIIVVFSLQNSVVVPIVFFNWYAQVPLVIVIFVSVFAGAMIIFCLALWRDFKRRLGKVSTKANEYKTIFENKKDSFSTKLNNKKHYDQDDQKKDQSLTTDTNNEICSIDHNLSSNQNRINQSKESI